MWDRFVTCRVARRIENLSYDDELEEGFDACESGQQPTLMRYATAFLFSVAMPQGDK